MLSPIPQLASDSPIDLLEKKRIRSNSIGVFSFYCLCFFCILNVNFFTRAFIGVEQAFSVLYLLSALGVLFSFQFKMRPALGQAGAMWLIAVISFLLIATRFGALDLAYYTSPQSNLYRTLVAQLLSVCAAMGARHLALAGRGQEMLRVVFGLAVMACLTIILTKKFPGILQYVGTQAQDRGGGFFQDPNRAGQACCATAAIGFAVLVGETTLRGRLFAYSGMLALVPCLFMTYSRSSILAMAGLVMMQFFISPIMKRKETLIAILVVAVSLPIGVAYVLNKRASNVDSWNQANVDAQKDRMESLFRILSGNFDDADTGSRFVLAARGLRYFASSPVIGVGYRVLAKMPDIGLGCHNTFIRIFGEAGFVAGMMFIGAVGFLALCGWRSKSPQVRCLVVGYAAMYTAACLVSHSVLTNRLHNVVVGVCFGLITAAATASMQDARQRRAIMLQRRAAAPVPQPSLPPADEAVVPAAAQPHATG